MGLDQQARLWPTSKALTGGPNSKREERGAGGPDLQEMVIRLWATPQNRDWRSGYAGGETLSKNARPLSEQAVSLWSTPRASDGEKGGPNQAFGAGGIPLTAQATSASSLPDLTMHPVGGTSSRERRTLNPLFVEWLMGWPPGWTLLAWTDFACSATALYRWKQAMRSALLQLDLAEEAPLQLGLFG